VLLALGDLHDFRLWLAMFGIIIIALLLILEVRAAMLIGIGFVTLVCWLCGLSPAPSSIVMLPSFAGTFWQFDFNSYFEFANVTIPLTLVCCCSIIIHCPMCY
jgi:AGZA family xanthine/uracil permease-like MFS transporter